MIEIDFHKLFAVGQEGLASRHKWWVCWQKEGKRANIDFFSHIWRVFEVINWLDVSHRLPDWFLNCPSQKASSTHPVHPPAPQRAQQVRGHAGLDGGRGGLREVDSTGENPSRATSPLIIDFQQLIVLTCTQFSNYDEDYNEEGNENNFVALNVALNVALRTLSLRVLKQSRTCSRLPRLRLLSSLSWI